MSRLILWAQASEWYLLRRFAVDLHVLPPGANGADEAARYLRYHHGLGPKGWNEVEEFARENRADLEGVDLDSRLGTFTESDSDIQVGYDASSIGQQWRLLFGFAAQYTKDAADLAKEHLIKKHRLGPEEWEAVDAFLESQEYYRDERNLIDPETEDNK